MCRNKGRTTARVAHKDSNHVSATASTHCLDIDLVLVLQTRDEQGNAV